MAGAGFKDFASGDELFASEVDTYLMQQSIMKFANATDRDDDLFLAPVAEGMHAYVTDINQVTYYQSGRWNTAYGQISYMEYLRSGAQSIANNNTTPTTITAYSAVSSRNPAMTYNNGIFTVKAGEAGIYSVAFNGNFTANTTGRRRVAILRNSTEVAGINISAPSSGSALISAATTIYLSVGETISAEVLQNSGAALDFNSARMIITKVSI